MSTRSSISLKNSEGQFETIYCHSDGYLEHNGRILLEYYTTYEDVKRLMELGDLSLLAKNLYPDPAVMHRFGNEQDGVCVAYGRDRREVGTEAQITTTIGCEQEYNYVFQDGVWFYFTDSVNNKTTLTPENVM